MFNIFLLFYCYVTLYGKFLNVLYSKFFREYLDLDIRLPQEKAEELSKLAVVHINAVLVELRRLLLAEDLVDSAKFFGILWVLTYVGALFNGLTLIIIGMIQVVIIVIFEFLLKFCFLFCFQGLLLCLHYPKFMKITKHKLIKTLN